MARRKYPKKPKQPKKGSSLATWRNWDKRMSAWEKKVKALKKAPNEKDRLRDKWQGKTVSSL